MLVRVAPRLRENVRERGEDVRCGERVLEPGAVIGPAEVGMLAALGRGVVAVRQRPRVAILSGGDELVEPDGDVSGGRIVASNSYSIAAQCREVGAEPVLPRHRARRSRGPRAPLPRGPARRRAGELGGRLGRRPRLRPPRAREARLRAGVLGREDQARLPAVLRPLPGGRGPAGVRPARESRSRRW